MKIILLLVLGLLLLQMVWTITDPRPLQVRLKDFFSKRSITLYSIVIILLVPPLINFLLFPLPPTKLDFLIITMGIAIFVIGESLAIWAKLTLGKFWGHAAVCDVKRQNRLITTGPFGFSRNPIYLGMFLMAFGFNLALRSFFIFLVLVLFVILRLVIQKEEKILEDHFGKNYLDYKKRVPRFLIIKT